MRPSNSELGSLSERTLVEEKKPAEQGGERRGEREGCGIRGEVRGAGNQRRPPCLFARRIIRVQSGRRDWPPFCKHPPCEHPHPHLLRAASWGGEGVDPPSRSGGGARARRLGAPSSERDAAAAAALRLSHVIVLERELRGSPRLGDHYKTQPGERVAATAAAAPSALDNGPGRAAAAATRTAERSQDSSPNRPAPETLHEASNAAAAEATKLSPPPQANEGGLSRAQLRVANEKGRAGGLERSFAQTAAPRTPETQPGRDSMTRQGAALRPPSASAAASGLQEQQHCLGCGGPES